MVPPHVPAAYAAEVVHRPGTRGSDTALLPYDAVIRELAERHGSRERAEALVRDRSAVLPAVDHEVVALLATVRGVVSVALVSNAITRLEHDLARHGLNDLADAVVNSARIGVAKPDFREATVTAAREAGVAALHHLRADDLREALAPFLGGAT